MAKPLQGTVQRSDLAGIVKIPGDLRSKPPTQIVVHRNTAHKLHRASFPDFQGSDLEALAAFHAAPGPYHFRLFPYHLFIDRDGTVSQIHSLMVVSPHCAGQNSRSIGVAFNCDGRIERPTEEQWSSAVRTLRAILCVFPGCGIVPHSLAKRCPGPLVSVATLAKEVANGSG